MIKDFFGFFLGWRICHKVFGWDYVLFESTISWHIRRLEVSPTGEEFVYWLGVRPLNYFRIVRHLTRKQAILAPVYDNQPVPRGTLINIST